jgi:hypothetical protein
MIVVIQCAAIKRADAGRLVTNSGKPVDFVADPQIAPADGSRIYARPDDAAANGKSWRQLLTDYNAAPGNNPLGLYPAYELYKRDVYRRLVDRFGVQNTNILSAGWGLIRADFLTPYYDITFSMRADSFKRRRKNHRYADFNMLADNTEDDVVFIGGKDYLPLFFELTSSVRGTRTVFYRSAKPPQAQGCKLTRFQTAARTNWHYECANAIIDGTIRF